MKVAIAGYGVEGESNYRYWTELGHDVTIVDEAEKPARPIPKDATTILGPRKFRELQDFDLVVRTAGLPPHFIVTEGQVWSSTNEFFKQCPAPIIGVTGTKGKGTTSSLIASILRAAGHTVHLVGNIGQPPLDVLADITPDDIVVFELSSFQLWDLERSPHVAVVLMIEPDHLNVHADFKDYIRAKSNIRRYQTADDVCFYHPTNPNSAKIATSSVLGDHIRYGVRESSGVYIEDGMFCVDGETICATSELRLPGAHNLENACAAISTARVFTLDNHAIAKGLRAFEGLPHRLKFVREVSGVKYYDDSIATTPGSAIAAIRSFDAPTTIILGGSQKGSIYDTIVQECKSHDVQVVAIGETGAGIADLCREMGVEVVEPGGGMTQIVDACHRVAKPGSVVILSPASASFDMFKSYADRGDQFVAAVTQLTD